MSGLSVGEEIAFIGKIKFFFVNQYGFVTSPSFSKDCLLDVCTVRKHGPLTRVPNGAGVTGKAILGTCGWKVSEIHNLDLSTAITITAAEALAKTHVVGYRKVGTATGKIKLAKLGAGFVFLNRKDQPDILIHMEIVRATGLAELRSGQVITVEYGSTEKGLCAGKIVL